MGYVPTDLLSEKHDGEPPDGQWEIEVVGRRRPAVRLTEAPFDPSGSRLRS
jgi:hypothetical protein